jgi:hypothetical protein
MSELQGPFNPPSAASQQPATQSSALVAFQLESQVAATFHRLAVKLSPHDLSIPEGLSSEDFLQLALAVARVEELPQWWWGSLWNYPGFAHGERKRLTEEPEWAGPSYDEWEHQGRAHGLYLQWLESGVVIHKSDQLFTAKGARAMLLPRSYFVKALSAPPEKRIALLERCSSGEIESIRELEAEISRIRDSIPVPNLKSALKGKKITTTDVEAQVQRDEKKSQESSTERANKLATAKLALEKQPFMRDAINQIARHGGEELADAIRLQEIDIGTEQIYTLAKHAPDKLVALAPRILEAKRFPLTPSGSDAPTQTRKEALGQYLTKIAEICSERFVRKLKDGEILPTADDVKLFGELDIQDMGEFEPWILKGLTFQEARDRQAEEQVKKLKAKLQTKLRTLFAEWLAKAKLGSRADQYRDALYKAVDKATYDELRGFAGFNPQTETDIDLEQIDPQKIKEAIKICHEHNKDKGSSQDVEISFHDILAIRSNSTPTTQAPGSGKDMEPLSEKRSEAIRQLNAILCDVIADPHQYFSNSSERDLVDWAFPESVLRTRQIWRSQSATESLHLTIKKVDTERLSALNVHDLAAWKSNMSGPEEFYFRGPRGLLFTLKIESPTGVLCELSERDKERFLSTEEAIRRYSREHGHLVNATVPAADSDAEIHFEESAL